MLWRENAGTESRATVRPGGLRSATAEPSDASGTAEADGDVAVGDDHRHLALALAMAQHLFHPSGIELDVVVDMVGIRLTGADGMWSAVLSVNDDCGHVLPPLIVLGKEPARVVRALYDPAEFSVVSVRFRA